MSTPFESGTTASRPCELRPSIDRDLATPHQLHQISSPREDRSDNRSRVTSPYRPYHFCPRQCQKIRTFLHSHRIRTTRNRSRGIGVGKTQSGRDQRGGYHAWYNNYWCIMLLVGSSHSMLHSLIYQSSRQ